MTAVRLGFGLPVAGSWATAGNMLRVARRAEELGYGSLWTFQRLLHPAEGAWDEYYRAVHDPIVALSYAAAVTDRVRLGLAVVNAPFYSPIVLAKQLTTLDEVSAGRLDAGLGLGWAQEEFAAAGVPYERRGARVEEFLRCLDDIWSQDVVQFDGRFYHLPRVRVDPKPVQRPHPPILLGGFAERALRRAGQLADGWISSSRQDLTKIGAAISTIKSAADEAGRDPAGLRFAVRGVMRLGATGHGGERRRLHGSADEIRSDLDWLAGFGVTEVFFDLNFDPEIGSPDADPAKSMEYAEEVLETFAPNSA